MQHTERATTCSASPPDPQPDRSGTTTPAPTTPTRTIPSRIAALLHTVRILLGYGRHLAATAEHRSASSDFNAVAACFGTGRLYAIMAHLQRGLLRAAALERVLLERAARGRDIGFLAPSERAIAAPAAPAYGPAATPAVPADLAVEQSADAPVELSSAAPVEPSAGAHVARKPAPRSRPAGWDDPELFMPTLEELVAQVRRRPLGRTLVDICLDLAVAPGFCTGAFWNELYESILGLGGSVATLMLEKVRRQEAFCKEQDRTVGSNWDWMKLGREGLRRALGFFIGEAANHPYDPILQQYAVATGPP
jgi:hypothetical protein